jgi:hypothetical protein
LAVHGIKIPGIVTIHRWLSLVRQLAEADVELKSEVRIRPGMRRDLDFFVHIDDISDSENLTLRQDVKFWDQYGFRCLYVGYFEDESRPFCLQYWIDDSDNHRFAKMNYGGMYQTLNSDTIHAEGGYVCKELRGKGLFRKFRTTMHRMLFLKGKKLVRSHIASNQSRIPSLKVAAAVGFIPDHWISRITIRLPFYKSEVFVHHSIRDTDWGKFPLKLFEHRSGLEQKLSI